MFSGIFQANIRYRSGLFGGEAHSAATSSHDAAAGVFGDSVSDLIGLGIEPKTSRTDGDVFNY